MNVTPILVEAIAPDQIATVTLRNTGSKPMNVQIRVFFWSQVDGDDNLQATEEVAASPPVATIMPGNDYLVRLVRQSAEPVKGEEAYRLVVDEIPDANQQKNGAIAVVLRYSIPVFFTSPEASQPKIAWSISVRGGRTYLVGRNSGDKRIRLSELKAGSIRIGRGLAGYVLGHSEHDWPVPGGHVTGPITAQGDRGPVNAPLSR